MWDKVKDLAVGEKVRGVMPMPGLTGTTAEWEVLDRAPGSIGMKISWFGIELFHAIVTPNQVQIEELQ